MKDDADQHKDNDDVLPSGEAACQCQCIQFKYTTNDLVTRCQDYDKVILDLQSLIMSLSNTVLDFKSHSNPPTTDGNNSWQVSDSNSHTNVLLQSPETPLTNSAQLAPNQSSSITLTDIECSGDNNTQSQPRHAGMDTLSKLPLYGTKMHLMYH